MSQEKYIAEIQKEAIQYAEKNYPNYSCAIFAESNHRIKIEQVSKDFIAGANSKAVDNRMVAFAEWLIYQDITQRGKSTFVDSNGNIKTTEQLLTEYKKGA